MKEYIKALTRISDDAYQAFYFENAGAFLDYYYGNDKDVTLMLMQCPAFWKWWLNQFEQIDEAFSLRFSQSEAPSHLLLKLWKQDHDPERMVAFPAQHVIEAAMSEVWSKAWKEEQQLNHAQKQKP